MPANHSQPALPISLYVAGKRVLLADGDSVADRRQERLVAAGADVVRLTASASLAEPLETFAVVFAHTGNRETDETLARSARRAGVLAYAHDQPTVSDFAMPAQVSLGPLKIAISTGGTAPALARRLRELLERLLQSGGPALENLVDELVSARRALPHSKRSGLYAIAKRLTLKGGLSVDGLEPVPRE